MMFSLLTSFVDEMVSLITLLHVDNDEEKSKHSFD